ncbi:uncharacterized protein N7483_008948 [Penicillium malachiteum]|uniref:uncharacterized protein n=1 Tax=Penicillium malachiteum TaxID=1324776 RepID=UPI002547F5D4|nr:uncharacterized protein N7483_008948 [Penicillium malachiteum]KAJ5721014.1 hypothetical protein N7483_008948 [Penicillium malachiteum]
MARTFIDILFRKELASLRDEELVQLLYADFGPEIDHLKGVPRAVEGDGKDFDEVNRTITNVRAVKWLLANEYEAFTANQPAVVKLSPETFQALRERVLPSWDDPDYLLALIVALVVGDMGKDPHLGDEIAARQGTGDKHDHENHDECLAEAVECGILNKTLNRLSDARRKEVVLGINVGATLNIPQLTQGENVPGSLQPLLQFRGHREAFNLKYQEIIFDVSGAGGHLDSRGATRMIEPVCQSFLQAWPILSDVITNERSLREAYDAVLQNRGELIAEKGFPLLSPTDPSDRALLRLFAMGRVADQATAEQFQDAFRGLPDTTRDALTNGLNVDGINDGDAVVIYYMPALFAETLRILRTASFEDRVIALQSLMGFMVRTFDGSQPQPNQPGSIKERNVSPAVDLVRTPAFHDNLRLLDDYTLPADS